MTGTVSDKLKPIRIHSLAEQFGLSQWTLQRRLQSGYYLLNALLLPSSTLVFEPLLAKYKALESGLINIPVIDVIGKPALLHRIEVSHHYKPGHKVYLPIVNRQPKYARIKSLNHRNLADAFSVPYSTYATRVEAGWTWQEVLLLSSTEYYYTLSSEV